MVCENAFAGMRRYGAVSAVYRNRRKELDDHLMLAAAGLGSCTVLVKTEKAMPICGSVAMNTCEKAKQDTKNVS